jgi:transposase-like protein
VKKKRKRKYQRHTVEFKVKAVERMLAGENVRALSRILAVSRSQLYEWLDRYREQGIARLRGPGRPLLEGEPIELVATPEELAAKRIAELERKVGQQTLEVDFLSRAFKRVKELRQPSTNGGATASTERSGQ